MTTKEIKEVNELQIQGFGYKKIASLTGINENTVKAYLRRHPVEPEEVSVPRSMCKYCGTPVTSLPRHKTKQFCSDACRMKWWKEHKDEVNKKAWYGLTCQFCGKEFRCYGDAKQKYCCRKCCDDSRRKAVPND